MKTLFFLLVIILISDVSARSEDHRTIYDLKALGLMTFVGPVPVNGQMVLVEQTVMRFCSAKNEEATNQSVKALSESQFISQNLAKQFVTKNNKPEILSDEFPDEFDPVLISTKEYERHFSGDDAKENWLEFRKIFPNALGVVRVSRLVFNDEGTQGLMSIWCQYSENVGRGGFVKFQKLGSVWWCFEVLDAPSGNS